MVTSSTIVGADVSHNVCVIHLSHTSTQVWSQGYLICKVSNNMNVCRKTETMGHSKKEILLLPNNTATYFKMLVNKYQNTCQHIIMKFQKVVVHTRAMSVLVTGNKLLGLPYTANLIWTNNCLCTSCFNYKPAFHRKSEIIPQRGKN